ncbi:MAG TPA: hypothetical protein VH371_00280 [Candidatus Limnocylindrales bacterium]
MRRRISDGILGVADAAVIAAIVAVAAACSGATQPAATAQNQQQTPPPPPSSAKVRPTNLCPNTCAVSLNGTGIYEESTSVDPLIGSTEYTAQGCIGPDTNWHIVSCGAAGQSIGQVSEKYYGVQGSTSDSCEYNADPHLSFDVPPGSAGQPSGTTNLHGLTYQGPLAISTSFGPDGLSIDTLGSTTVGQVTCIGSKETAGGGVMAVPLVAGFACGPAGILPAGNFPQPSEPVWAPGPVIPTLTNASRGQYSAKFACYYGPEITGTGSVDIELTPR